MVRNKSFHMLISMDQKLLKEVIDLLTSLEFCISEGDFCSVCPSCQKCTHKHHDQGYSGHRKGCELNATLIKLKQLHA